MEYIFKKKLISMKYIFIKKNVFHGLDFYRTKYWKINISHYIHFYKKNNYNFYEINFYKIQMRKKRFFFNLKLK